MCIEKKWIHKKIGFISQFDKGRLSPKPSKNPQPKELSLFFNLIEFLNSHVMYPMNLLQFEIKKIYYVILKL